MPKRRVQHAAEYSNDNCYAGYQGDDDADHADDDAVDADDETAFRRRERWPSGVRGRHFDR